MKEKVKIVSLDDFLKLTKIPLKDLVGRFEFNYMLKSCTSGETYECGCGKKHYIYENHTKLRWHSKPGFGVGIIKQIIIQDENTHCKFINYLEDTGSLLTKFKTKYSAKIKKGTFDRFFLPQDRYLADL